MSDSSSGTAPAVFGTLQYVIVEDFPCTPAWDYSTDSQVLDLKPEYAGLPDDLRAALLALDDDFDGGARCSGPDCKQGVGGYLDDDDDNPRLSGGWYWATIIVETGKPVRYLCEDCTTVLLGS